MTRKTSGNFSSPAKFKNGMAFGRTNTEAIFHNVPPPAAIIDLQKLDTLLVFHCTANCDPAPLF